jgi:cytosine/adenosine deaminase-related metal-dependent hydrolase
VRDVLELATIGGAYAVHLDSRIGSLARGKQADIVSCAPIVSGMSPVNDASPRRCCTRTRATSIRYSSPGRA